MGIAVWPCMAEGKDITLMAAQLGDLYGEWAEMGPECIVTHTGVDIDSLVYKACGSVV